MCRIDTQRWGRRGSVLGTVLPMSLVLSLLAITLLSTSLTHIRLSGRRRAAAAAFELAEGGLHHAINAMTSNKNYAGQNATALGDGSFSVTVSQPTANWNQKLVVATGQVVLPSGSVVQRRVSALADFQARIWDYGIIVNQDATMAGTTIIDSAPTMAVGNVHSNGSLTIGSNTTVAGKATAVGTITNNGTVTGGTQSAVPAVPFPTVDSAGLLAQAQALGITNGDVSLSSAGIFPLSGEIVGNLSVSGQASITVNGLLWVTGTVTLSGQSYAGDGTLICQGTMSLSGGSGFTGGETNNLALVTLSSANPALTLSGNSTIRGPLFAPNGGTSISGTVSLNGTLATNTLSMAGTAHLTRNTNLRSPWALASGPRVRYWQEL